MPIAQTPAALAQLVEFSQVKLTPQNERTWFEWARTHCGPVPLARLRPLQQETSDLLRGILLVQRTGKSGILPAMTFEHRPGIFIQHEGGVGRVRLMSEGHGSVIAADRFRLFAARTLDGFEDRIQACESPTCGRVFVTSRKRKHAYCSNLCYRREWMRWDRDPANDGSQFPGLQGIATESKTEGTKVAQLRKARTKNARQSPRGKRRA